MYPFRDQERVGGPRLPLHTGQPLLSHIDLFAEDSVCAASGGEGRSEGRGSTLPSRSAFPFAPPPTGPSLSPLPHPGWAVPRCGEPVDEGPVDLWRLGLVPPSPDPSRSFPNAPESGAQAGV